MIETAFPKGVLSVKNNKYLLLLSTLALIGLSITRRHPFTATLVILWIACYIVSVRHRREDAARNQYSGRTCSFVSLSLLVVLALNFYYSFSCGKPYDILVSFGVPAAIIPPCILLLTCAGCFVGFFALYLFAPFFIDFFQPVADVVKKMYKQYLVLSAVYVCGLLAIIRANFYYIDDLGRATTGFSIEGSFSRYMSGLLSIFLHGNGYLSDISPLPQIVAALIMALAAVITLSVITQRTEFRILDLVCMIPFGLSPYFLECLSYKYDAPYMAFSVLAAVIPLLMCRRRAVYYILSIAACTIAVCTSYQVSAGIFPMCVAFLCFVRWSRGEKIREILPFLFRSFTGYAIGILYFRLVLMRSIAADDYVSASIDLRAFPANMTEYVSRILGDFNLFHLALMGLILAGFILAVCAGSKRKKTGALFMSILTLSVMFVLSYSLYSILSRPIIYPRSMYGFGILLSILSCYTIANSKALLSRASICLLAWLFFVFTFTYGNALNVQKTYADFRIRQVITDLSSHDLLKDPTVKRFTVHGTIGYPESIQNMLPVYPVLEDLVPPLFADSIMAWNTYQFQHYYGITNLVRDASYAPADDMILLVDSMYHTIYGNERYILIELK